MPILIAVAVTLAVLGALCCLWATITDHDATGMLGSLLLLLAGVLLCGALVVHVWRWALGAA